MARLAALAVPLRDLAGWRRYALAALLGAALAAAQAPLYLWPLGLGAIVLLLLMVAAARPGRGFATLYAFAYGHFVAGLYWIGIAFFVDAEKFALLLPLPVLGLPALLALFPAAGAALALACSPATVQRLLLLPFGWLLGEWLRGQVLTGFPWNLVGHVWGDTLVLLQSAAWLGAHGLGLVTMLACSGLAIALLPGLRRGGRVAALLPVLLPVLLAGAGQLRLAAAPDATVPGVMLRLVQPSVAQSLKWRDEMRQQHLQRHLALSLQPAAVPVTHIIWPETAVPYLLDEEAGLRAHLARLLPPGGALVAGGVRRAAAVAGSPQQFYNSVFALDAGGAVAARYDKLHLVPFGEYLPWRGLLSRVGLDALAVGAVDFSPGMDAAPMAIPGLPLARALVCYEIVFADEIAAPGQPRPGLLLNLTNDAWFGLSSGPHQHFAAARFRAVEQGLPLVRAANTGISAIVDAHGRITASLGLEQVGVVDGPLPVALAEAPYHARTGDLPALVLAVLVLLAAALRHRVGRRGGHYA